MYSKCVCVDLHAKPLPSCHDIASNNCTAEEQFTPHRNDRGFGIHACVRHSEHTFPTGTQIPQYEHFTFRTCWSGPWRRGVVLLYVRLPGDGSRCAEKYDAPGDIAGMLASHDDALRGVVGLTARPGVTFAELSASCEGGRSLLDAPGDRERGRSIRCDDDGAPGTLVPHRVHSRPFRAHTPQYGHFIFNCFEGS
jgi:hypothetical protein